MVCNMPRREAAPGHISTDCTDATRVIDASECQSPLARWLGEPLASKSVSCWGGDAWQAAGWETERAPVSLGAEDGPPVPHVGGLQAFGPMPTAAVQPAAMGVLVLVPVSSEMLMHPGVRNIGYDCGGSVTATSCASTDGAEPPSGADSSSADVAVPAAPRPSVSASRRRRRQKAAAYAKLGEEMARCGGV
eukprot:CAMPEP_0117569936 /NCGR_PEP_ID=MMETSP0784-20121206/58926_1 /TAXON_ID=39447 /ORGANISM="" /LENGTH=190 /DNA_ID=CAMNT_0005367947 /DNA_START=1 /DNA_END=573 /DNA_ORIENTATION=-